VRAARVHLTAVVCVLLAAATVPVVVLAADVAPDEPPGADLRFPDQVEIVVVCMIGLAAIGFWLMTRPLGAVGSLLATVFWLPIIEEWLFRYVLMYLIVIGVCGCPAWLAYVIVGVLFGVLHLLLALTLEPHVFAAPPGFQVGEGLFIACFNGLLFLNFILVHHYGLLITMIYVWLAHILINGVAVVYNTLVNFLLGGNLLAHLAPRVLLGLCAVFYFCYVYVNQTIVIPGLFGC
jgi:membrane protease YdiL (CAAX protease family)